MRKQPFIPPSVPNLNTKALPTTGAHRDSKRGQCFAVVLNRVPQTIQSFWICIAALRSCRRFPAK